MAGVAESEITVLTIPLRSVDASNADSFRGLVDEHITPQCRLVLDLANVDFIDSAGLGAVVWCIRRVNGVAGRCCICHAGRAVQTLFDLVRMERITDVFSSSEDARNSFLS